MGDAGSIVDGDGKANAFHAGVTVFRGHHANHFAPGIVHRAAGIAGVDSGVDLEHVDGIRAFPGLDGPVKGADVAGAHGELQLAQGIAHGVDCFAHAEAVTVAKGGGREVCGIYFQNGDIVAFLHADDAGVIAGAVMEDHRDILPAGIGILNHMVVGDNVAVFGDDKAGTADCGGAGHAEEVGVVHLAGDAHHLLAGHIIHGRGRNRTLFPVVHAHCQRTSLADGGLVLQLGDTLFQGFHTVCHPGADECRAAQAAQQGAHQAETKGPGKGPDPAAALFCSLGLFRFPGRFLMGRIVPGGDGAVFFPDIVGVGINLLGITVFVMVFPIHPVRLGLARLIRRIRIDNIIVSGYEHPA